MYDDTGEKTAAEGENDEVFAVHENVQTGDEMNSPRRNGFDPLDKADESGEEFKTNGQQKSVRIDRFGNDIIARKVAR